MTPVLTKFLLTYALKKRVKTWLPAIYCTHVVSVASSFVGKLYTHQRSEHIPGVRFCKCLLVNLLTGQCVCFSCFAFISSPLPILITLSNILSWSVCLACLNLKKTDPKQAIGWKKCIKSSIHPVHTKHNSLKIFFFFFLTL